MTSVSAGPVFGKIWARYFRTLLPMAMASDTAPDGNFQSLEKTAAKTSNDWKSAASVQQPASGIVYEFGGTFTARSFKAFR